MMEWLGVFGGTAREEDLLSQQAPSLRLVSVLFCFSVTSCLILLITGRLLFQVFLLLSGFVCLFLSVFVCLCPSRVVAPRPLNALHLCLIVSQLVYISALFPLLVAGSSCPLVHSVPAFSLWSLLVSVSTISSVFDPELVWTLLGTFDIKRNLTSNCENFRYLSRVVHCGSMIWHLWRPSLMMILSLLLMQNAFTV